MEALRVAAKVAISIGILEGCRTAPATTVAAAERESEAPPPDVAPQVEPPAPADDVEDEHATAPVHQPSTGTDCRAVVAAAFPVEGRYPGERKIVADGVRTCCAHLLLDKQQRLEGHRWDCCANVDDPPEEIAIACTPWGPPMPPAFHRDARVA
jgi:hypothetical protein